MSDLKKPPVLSSSSYLTTDSNEEIIEIKSGSINNNNFEKKVYNDKDLKMDSNRHINDEGEDGYDDQEHEDTEEESNDDENNSHQQPPPLSSANDIITRPPSKPVPISDRRGLFSRFILVPEQETALGHSSRIKGFIVFIVSTSAIIAPMGASILLPALKEVADDLHVTTGVVNVSFGLYVLSLGIFPLWWSSFSELNGRRTVYVVSFILYTLFSIGCALSKNIASLMVLRVLAGGAAASVQAVGAGTIGDIFVTTQRGRAMGYFYLGPLCGPLLAPILGGALTTKWGWRGTQWFCVILGGIMTCLIIFGLPETLKRSYPIIPANQDPVSSQDETQGQSHIQSPEIEHLHEDEANANIIIADTLAPAPSRASRNFVRDDEKALATMFKNPLHNIHLPHHHHHSKNGNDISKLELTKHVFTRPLRSFRFLKYPPVPLSMVYSSYCFCALYFLNIGIESLYSAEPYHYKSIILGLLYIPNSVGYIVSSVANGYWSDYVIGRSIKKYGRVIPEERLSESVYLAAGLFPVSLLIFGWAAHAHTFWLIPMIGTFLFGIASMLIFGNVMTYLIDVLPGRGSSGVALNNLFRMVLAAIATFVAQPLQDAMGFGWLYTMLAIGSIFAFISIVAIKKWGPKWRQDFDITTLY